MCQSVHVVYLNEVGEEFLILLDSKNGNVFYLYTHFSIWVLMFYLHTILLMKFCISTFFIFNFSREYFLPTTIFLKKDKNKQTKNKKQWLVVAHKEYLVTERKNLFSNLKTTEK